MLPQLMLLEYEQEEYRNDEIKIHLLSHNELLAQVLNGIRILSFPTW